jgi:hypothetical protein
MCELTSVGTVFAIITFIESLVFGFFTMMMLYDQISGVLEEDFRSAQHYQAQIHAYEAAMKTDAKHFSDPPLKPVEKSTYELFQEVFGGEFGLSWFNPFTRPDAIVEYWQTELSNCVRNADHVTDRFVKFVSMVQNGEIVLEDGMDDVGDLEDEEGKVVLTEKDFEIRDGTGKAEKLD